MKALILLAALALLPGCMSYKHTGPNGETTSVSAFLIKGEASKIHTASRQTDGFGTNYFREVSLGSLKGETEIEKLSGLAEAIARGVATGANPVKPVK